LIDYNIIRGGNYFMPTTTSTAKENINSGIPLTASPGKLHQQLVSSLCDSSNMPLDVFDKVEVIREERYCVPAYCFYCNGTASFTYEVGDARSQTYTVDRGNKVEIYEKTRTEWTPNSSSASISQTVFASGNKKLAAQISALYADFNPKNLVDIDELEFPHDVVTYDYNLPQPVAFNDYVQPALEEMLEEKALDNLIGNTRNFSIGGSNIHKEVVYVLLGLYRVIYKYNDQEYSIWLTGDGNKKYIDGDIPVDSKREAELDAINQAKEKAISAVPDPKNGMVLEFGLVGAAILGFIGLTEGIGVGIFLAIVGFFPGLLVGAIHYIYVAGCNSSYDQQRKDIDAKFSKEIEALEAEVATAAKQFKERKQPLRGIYEHEIAGDASAF